ncbi:MAG: radical SAM/SPASM domain-containing protein [Candidatus Paceibacterota bacterium]
MKIQFESSTACNAKCVFCPRYNMTRPKGEMTDELFHKIIKEGKEMGIKLFSPFLNGEPFVFPKIYEWLDYMEKEGVMVILYTNGEFLDADRLIKYPNIRYVNCSFNGATKETYDKVMRGPNFDKTRENIKYLISKAPFRVKVSMIVTEENAHEQKLFKEMWGRHAKLGGYANWAGAMRSALEKKGKRRPCYHLLNHLTILWDGRVNLCCMDYDGKVILGDLNKQSLKEVLKNIEPLRERHKKLDFDMPLCKDCNLNTI